MVFTTRRTLLATLSGLALAGCAGSGGRSDPTAFEPARFQPWRDDAAPYRVHPGDGVEVTVHTADELSGEYPVAPDGRINLPLAGAVMIADMTAPEAARTVAQRYSSVLRDPIVEVRPTSFGSQRILVGGEVNEPGLYDMPSARIGVLEAVLLAGGPTIRAQRREVAVMRRAPDGGVMLRRVNLASALEGGAADSIPLSRHDIVFVPRSGIAEVNDFLELYVRNIIPIDNAFAYALADNLFNE
jgi:polysaccharide export outer membrane protein